MSADGSSVEVTRPQRVDRTTPSQTPVHTAPHDGAWVLKLLTGPGAGDSVSIVPGNEYVFGRGRESDVALAEDLVSRRHAILSCVSKQPMLSDLGSTNGTFVNGERITRATLKGGDRLLIGTTIARLEVVRDTASRSQEIPVLAPTPRRHPDSTMTGRLDEVPPVDLIQLFATSRKSGTLLVREGGGLDGEIVLVEGRLAAARVSGKQMLTHRKALMRILRATKGEFEFVPLLKNALPVSIPEELQEPTELLLMDALRLSDELAVLTPELPSSDARLRLVRPMPGRLRSLEPEALDLLQLGFEFQLFSNVVDRSTLDDVDAVRGLLRLVSLGYLKVMT